MTTVPREEGIQELLADVLILQGATTHLLHEAFPDEADRREALRAIMALILPDIEARYTLLAGQSPLGPYADRWKECVSRRWTHFEELGKQPAPMSPSDTR
jgi:hypothetical protein